MLVKKMLYVAIGEDVLMKIQKTLNGKKILLADDDLISQFAVETLLKEEGFQVVSANNGQEAVKLFDDSINAVIIDYQMPIMNGIEAAQLIRKLEKKSNKKRPIIIVGLTGNAEKNTVKNFINAGINAVFQKPIKSDDFKKITEILNDTFL